MSKGVENMSEKILIIDDEQDIADLLEVYLKNENYVVYKFYCATDAMSCIESGDIDLAILDIMLPDMNGFSLCQLIRKKYTYPIIMLTAKIEETDKITGLTLGADDYVTKPYSFRELLARIRAVMRRNQAAAQASGTVDDGGHVVPLACELVYQRLAIGFLVFDDKNACHSSLSWVCSRAHRRKVFRHYRNHLFSVSLLFPEST